LFFYNDDKLLLLLHVQHTADAITALSIRRRSVSMKNIVGQGLFITNMHVVETVVDLRKRTMVSDIFINLDLA
jgi:hypothetical protein